MILVVTLDMALHNPFEASRNSFVSNCYYPSR